jgi:hypothetical protein
MGKYFLLLAFGLWVSSSSASAQYVVKNCSLEPPQDVTLCLQRELQRLAQAIAGGSVRIVTADPNPSRCLYVVGQPGFSVALEP